MKKKHILAALMVSLVAGSAFAAVPATSTFQANASITSSCMISANNVSFGTITPAPSGTLTATGSIKSTCTKSTAYDLEIGWGPDGELYDNRLYHTDALASNNLSDPTTQMQFTIGLDDNNSRQKSLVGTGTVDTTQLIAELPLNQFVKPGNYISNMIVYLNY